MKFCTIVTLIQLRGNLNPIVHTCKGIGPTMSDANSAALDDLKRRLGQTLLGDDQRAILFGLTKSKAGLESHVQALNRMNRLQANMHGFSIVEIA